MLKKLSPGSYVVGLKQSMKMIESHKAKKVYLANDADFFISAKISDACLANGIESEISYAKSELGKMCKIEVGAAVVTILN